MKAKKKRKLSLLFFAEGLLGLSRECYDDHGTIKYSQTARSSIFIKRYVPLSRKPGI